MAEKFGYNDALTSDNLRKLRIKLPIEYKEDGSRVYDSEKDTQMKDLCQIGVVWKSA